MVALKSPLSHVWWKSARGRFGKQSVSTHKCKEYQIGREHCLCPWNCLQNWRESISRYSQELDFSQILTGTWLILLTQELKVSDHGQLRLFADRVSDHLKKGRNFGKKPFLARVHLWMNWYINKQKCVILDYANLHAVYQVTMHPKKLIVWCEFAVALLDHTFLNTMPVIVITGKCYRFMSRYRRYSNVYAKYSIVISS